MTAIAPRILLRIISTFGKSKMSNLMFSQETAIAILNSGDQFPVDLDHAWQWLGYSTKQKARKKLVNNFDISLDFLTKWLNVPHSNGLSASRVEKFFLTIDCFKSLGMTAGTSQGKEIRKYFLDCEAIAKNTPPDLPVPQTLSAALRLAADLEDEKQSLLQQAQRLIAVTQVLESKVEVLAAEVAIAKPTMQKWELFCSADGWMTGEQICKQLCIPKLSVRVLFEFLRKDKVIFRRSEGGLNMPCKKWEDQGLATLRAVKCRDNVTRQNLMFSYKSLDRIFDILRFQGFIPLNSEYQLSLDSQIIEMKHA